MKGYYYIDSRRNERLYVPFNFIAIWRRGEIEVIFNPNKISRHAAFMKRNAVSFARGLVSRVEIDDNKLDIIQDSCFSGDEKGARASVEALFGYVRRNWREISIGEWE